MFKMVASPFRSLTQVRKLVLAQQGNMVADATVIISAVVPPSATATSKINPQEEYSYETSAPFGEMTFVNKL